MQYPLASVIMPVRNEEACLAESLEAVLGQDYPADRMEVIVVDGMSSDGTRGIVRSFQRQHRNLRLISNPRKTVPAAMNAAMAAAVGEVIVRVDGHCRIARDYVRRCVEHLQSDAADGVGGAIETIGDTPLARTVAAAMSSWFGVGGSAFRVVRNKTVTTDTIPFPAYTRSIIDRAGAYDEELTRNQDDEYNYRLRKLGAKLILAADIGSCYHCRSTIRRLARQYFEYGYWKVRVMQKHPRQMQPRHFVPVLFVTALLFALLLAPFALMGRWTLALVTGSYLVANVGASVVIARKPGWGMLALLPIAFATIHLSYGFGFLAGLLKFWRRWGRA
jgi:succinoglycan biosynthesis protein ExoA